ncbi:hypothetical protein ACHAPV_002776 [Trichoderma viride]
MADSENSEKELELFLGKSIECRTRQFVDFQAGQRNLAVHEKQRGGAPTENNETSVEMLIDDLSAVDRQLNHHDLNRNKDENLALLYEWLYWWISSFFEYKAFDVNQSRMLWITGALGTGKSTCMSAVMWGLSQKKHSTFLPLFFSFSRGDNGQPKPENAASAVKSLIYAILMDQSCLVDVLVDEHKSTGRKRFSHANDFYALSQILNRMVQDQRFRPTLILVDSVDEIRGDDKEYSRFLKLMKVTTNISPNVKWLVSADTLPSSDEIDIRLQISLDKGCSKKLDIINNFYIPYKVKELNFHLSHDGTFTDRVTELLQNISSGDFFWADTAFEIARREDPQSVLDVLQRMLDFLNSSEFMVSPYLVMMDKIARLPIEECSRCLIILGAMAEVYQPISLAELSALANLPPNADVKGLITKHCFAFLEICDDLATSSTTLDDVSGGAVSCISFSNNGRRLAAAVDEQIKIWDMSTYTIIVSQEVAYQKSPISGLAFSKNDALLALASGNRISLWKLTEEPAQSVNNEVVDGAVNAEGKPIGNSLRLGKKKFFFLPKYLGLAFHVAFSPNSKYIATIAGDVIYIWDLRSRKRPSILIGHESGVNAIAFSPDASCLASASGDGTVRIWEAPWDDEHKQAQLILRGHSSEVYNLSFSPLDSDKYIVSCSADQTLCIWDYSRHEVKTAAGASIEVGGEVDQQVSGHKKPISCLALSIDGKIVASGSTDGLICLWDEDIGSFRGQIREHRKEIISLEFSHDSWYLLSSAQDRTVRVWDVTNGLQLLLIRHTDWVRSAIFSPDGKFVASGCDDSMVRVWDMQHLVDERNNEENNDTINYNYTHKL